MSQNDDDGRVRGQPRWLDGQKLSFYLYWSDTLQLAAVKSGVRFTYPAVCSGEVDFDGVGIFAPSGSAFVTRSPRYSSL